jgi:hypothetical protein
MFERVIQACEVDMHSVVVAVPKSCDKKPCRTSFLLSRHNCFVICGGLIGGGGIAGHSVQLYAAETGASVDLTASTVTVARVGDIRFYRIRRSGEVFANNIRITKASLTGANVVISFVFESI